MFDDLSCHKLLSNAPESPLALLSHFELVYVGEEFNDPINQLLVFFIFAITKQAATMSITMLTTLMQSHHDASLAQTHHTSLFRAIRGGAVHGDNAQIQSILLANQKLTQARIGYLLFCIKVERKLNLGIADYQVMLHFYQCYLTTEISRFTKSEPEYAHQRKVCLNLMECAAKAIEQIPIAAELKNQIMKSNEYGAIMASYHKLQHEQDEKSCKVGGI
jgi:hypothetical protein